MYQLKMMMNQMQDELKDAQKYINCAMEYKDKDKMLAEMYYNLSTQEMKHHDEIMAHATRILKEHPAYDKDKMQIIFDWEKEREMEWAKDIKMKQAMYKGQ